MKLTAYLVATDASGLENQWVSLWVASGNFPSSVTDEELFDASSRLGHSRSDKFGVVEFTVSNNWSQNVVALFVTIQNRQGDPIKVSWESSPKPNEITILIDNLPTSIPKKRDFCDFYLEDCELVNEQRFVQFVRLGVLDKDTGEVRPPHVSKFNIVETKPLTEEEIAKLKAAQAEAIDEWTPSSQDAVATPEVGYAQDAQVGGLSPEMMRTAAKVSGESEMQESVRLVGEPALTLEQFSRVPIPTPATMQLTGTMVQANYMRHTFSALAKAYGAVRDTVPARYEMDCDNPIDWDLTPTIRQACEPYFLHAIHFSQRIKYKGPCAGKVTYTSTLLPCQEKQIATVSWKRNEGTKRSENRTAVDRLSNSLSRSRDIEDIQKATVRESMRGSSTSSTAGISASISAPLGNLPVKVGVSGGFSKSKSSASQNSSRNMTAQASQKLRDNTFQAAESVRSQTVTVTHEVSQEEAVSAVTESIKNYNRMHAMHLVVKEVNSRYEIEHQPVGVVPTVAIPFVASMFDELKVLRWRKYLEPAVHSSLVPAFDAIERIMNKYAGSTLPEGRYADATLRDISGVVEAEFNIAQPKFDQFNLDKFIVDKPWFTPTAWLLEQWKQLQEGRIDYYRKNIAPKVAFELAKHIFVRGRDKDHNKIALPLDPTPLTRLGSDGRIKVAFNLNGAVSQIKRSDIASLEFFLADKTGQEKALDDFLPEGSQVIVHSGEFDYLTDFQNELLFSSNTIRDDLDKGNTVFVRTPLNPSELEDPVISDTKYRDRLLQVLNTNLVSATEAILQQLAQNEPSHVNMLLDAIKVPNDPTRTIRDIIGNFIGISDCALLFELAPGFDELTDGMIDLEDGETLLDHYTSDTPTQPTTVSVPTGAVHMEAYLGKCVLREKIDHSRAVDWDMPCESNITPISPVSTDSRRADTADTTPTDFAQPMINLQTAPAAPDYLGTSAMISAITQPDIFKDITGLAGTQKNTMEAFKESLKYADNARSEVALAASRMAEREQGVKNIDRLGSRLKDAVNDGLLDEEEAKKKFSRQVDHALGADIAVADKGIFGGRNETPIDSNDIIDSLFENNVQKFDPENFDLSLVDINDPASFVDLAFPVQTVDLSHCMIMVLGAANNLNKYALKDIAEALNAARSANADLSSGYAHIGLLEYKDDKQSGVFVFEINKYGGFTLIEKWENAGGDLELNDEVINCFLARALITTMGVNSIALGLWSHGSGAGTYAGEGTVLHRDGKWRLTYKNLSKILQNVHSTVGRSKLNILFTDSCLNGNIELAYEIKDSCNIFIGSELSIPGNGYDYGEMFIEFWDVFANDEQWALWILNSYKKYYSSKWSTTTLAAVQTINLDTLLSTIDDLVGTIISSSSKEELLESIKRAKETSSGSDCYDLISVFSEFRKRVSDTMLLGKIDVLLLMLSSPAQDIIVGNVSQGRNSSHFNGLSAWIPTTSKSLNLHKADYETLKFAKNSAWISLLEFLNA